MFDLRGENLLRARGTLPKVPYLWHGASFLLFRYKAILPLGEKLINFLSPQGLSKRTLRLY